MPLAVTGKAGDDAIGLLEGKLGLEGCITRLTRPADGLGRAATNDSFQAGLVEVAKARLYREGAAI